eukprot:scaffold19216_cov97-Isochrysis_galbana.AAC.5
MLSRRDRRIPRGAPAQRRRQRGHQCVRIWASEVHNRQAGRGADSPTMNSAGGAYLSNPGSRRLGDTPPCPPAAGGGDAGKECRRVVTVAPPPGTTAQPPPTCSMGTGRCNPMRRRPPPIICPPRQQVADIYSQAAARCRHGAPRPVRK